MRNSSDGRVSSEYVSYRVNEENVDTSVLGLLPVLEIGRDFLYGF